MNTPRVTKPVFPPHFDGKRFFNPNGLQAQGFLRAMRWKLTSRPEPTPGFVTDVVPSKPPAFIEGDELRVTMVNHSTVLLQERALHVLTDPIWSERASPLTFAGPKRFRQPGVRWDDLPRIDVVVLSHNHYDHLDLATLRKLVARDHPRFVVPKGVGTLLKSQQIGPIDELDWGDSVSLPGALIHGVPAFHFSARGLFDRNRTLWCGFVIETANRMIYFAGDTAQGNHIASIREQFGPPQLALLPIGAYQPRWFMSSVHMAPDEAIRAHEILGADLSVATHHGTFQLADEGIDTPMREFLSYQPPASFVVLANGHSITQT